MRIHSIVIAFIVLHSNVVSQVRMTARNEYGVVGGLSLNDHMAEFSKLGSYPSCCPEFTGGSGTAPYAGLFATFPTSDSWKFQFRLLYASSSGTLADDETSWVADLRDSAQVVQAIFTHTIDATITSIGIEPFVMFRPFGKLDVMLGGRVAYTTTASFHQTEILTEPADYGAYLGSGRVWVDTQAEIPDATAIQATIGGGLRYVLPLNKRQTLFLAPEISYHYPLTTVTSSVDWSVSQIRLGLALGWSPDEQQPDTTPQPPPTQPRIPKSTASIVLLERVLDGKGLVRFAPLDSIVVEDTNVVDQLPLLPHVYFDKGSATIPQRFMLASSNAFMHSDEIPMHNAPTSALGVIAQRLRDNPDANVSVIGNASDIDGDKGAALAQQRADAVREALVSYGIVPTRINTVARRIPNLPTRASTSTDEEYAHEENRRVEIVPSESSILDPITIRSIRRSVRPDSVHIAVNISAPSGIAEHYVTFRGPFTEFTLNTEDELQYSVTDTLTVASSRLVTSATSLSPTTTATVELRVTDSTHQTIFSADTSALVELSSEQRKTERKLDVQVERYFLILFSFDDASLSVEHRAMLSRVRERIAPNSRVKIIGKTDVMGTPEYNVELSRKRAQEVADILDIESYTIEALGSSGFLYDNNAPEGRAYNRTVLIEVITPL